MKVYVFPGQGAQVKGMGKDLFDEFESHTMIADEVLGYSIKELCLNDEEKKLDITKYTQPALYVVNALSYYKKIQEGEVPDYVLGHSLGEYNALLAANVFNFKTGLQLVKKRGELMYQAMNGGMAAVLGLNKTEIEDILNENKLNQLDIANYNTPSQFVLSGSKESIQEAQSIFKENGVAKYIILNVSGAFHSRYMSNAAIEFAQYLSMFTLSKPEIEVISNYTARPYQINDIFDNMTKQIDHSVRWIESIEYLRKKGAMQDYKQIGPGRTVLGMVKTILR